MTNPVGMLRGLRIPLAFSPALVTGWLVARNAVNVPVWDDWERIPLLAAWKAGTLGFADLYAPHIDHRIVFPRLLMLANLELSGGDLRVEMGFTFAVALAGAAALAALLQRTLGPRAAPAILFANLLLFSPLQWENFLWAIQTAFVLPLACLAGALLALAAPLSSRARFAVCLALAVVATHSFGHGLLLWPAVAGYVLLEPGDRPRRGFLAAWLLAAALVLVPYFGVGGLENQSLHAYGIEHGADAPGLEATRGAQPDPRAAAVFWLKMLGSPLARVPWWPSHALAPGLGLALLALFAAAWLAARRSAVYARALPWLVLGAAGIAGCALAGLGRAGLPVHPNYALVPRYTAIGTQLLVALVALAALLLPRPVAAAVGVALALSLTWAWNVGVHGMSAWREARMHARTSLIYIQHFPPRYAIRLDWDADSARSWAVQADRLGLLDPPLAAEPRLAPFQVEPSSDGGGQIESVRARIREGGLRVRGRAGSHGVLLVHMDGSGARVLAVGEIRTRLARHQETQDQIFDALEPGDAEPGRWTAEVPLAALPPGTRVELEIFAVDAAALVVARAAERVVVLRQGDRVEARVERAD